MSKRKIDSDPVIEFYKKKIGPDLIRENLRLTVQQRIDKLMRLQKLAEELRQAGREQEINSLTDAALKSND